jgi:histidyl-tRNA synthetase
MTTTRTSPVSFLKLAADVSSFYGFHSTREVERRVNSFTRRDERPRMSSARIPHTFVSTAALCASCASSRPQEPVLAFYATPSPTHLPRGYSQKDVGEFGLQIVGTTQSVGEIVLFKTLATILTEWNSSSSVRIRINPLGDRDSKERFNRELTLHVRKHASRFEEADREQLLATPALLYSLENDLAREVAMEAPRSINFLSERSRVHFRSILEYLEHLGFPYELDDMLMGDERNHHIAFAMDIEGEDATLIAAMGGRYDDYLRGHGRKSAAGVGASIFFRKKGAVQGNFALNTSSQKPRVYFAQLGLKAKLQGLVVLEMLRNARIPVEQSFDSSHLSTQLAAASAQGVSHLLIMGQREALDGTIIVRSMQNSAQSTLQLSDIPRFLKTLR